MIVQFWDEAAGKPVTVSNSNPLPTGASSPGPDSITSDMLAPGAVTTDKFAADAKAPSAATADEIAWSNVTGKPNTFPPTIGTTASTAAAGNHTHAAATTSAAGFMSQAMVTKLNGIAANAVDATGAVTAIAAKSQIAALSPIADPANTNLEDVATLLNAVVAALKA